MVDGKFDEAQRIHLYHHTFSVVGTALTSARTHKYTNVIIEEAARGDAVIPQKCRCASRLLSTVQSGPDPIKGWL